MRTWKFCVIVWVLIVALHVVLARVLPRPEPMGRGLDIGWPALLGKAEKLTALDVPAFLEELRTFKAPPKPATKAARAAEFISAHAGMYDETSARACLADYGALTRQHPDLRPALAGVLYERAAENAAKARSGTSDRADTIARVLVPAALDEVGAMARAESENAFWPVLLLHHELFLALREPEVWPKQPPGTRWVPYRPVDDQALERAKALAAECRRRPSFNSHWRDRVKVVEERFRERGSGPHVAKALAVPQTPLPALALLREVARGAGYLGYTALQNGQTDEARGWFAVIRQIGRGLLERNGSELHSFVGFTLLGMAEKGLLDAWGREGEILNAGQHHEALWRVDRTREELSSRTRSQDWLAGLPLEYFQRFLLVMVYAVSLLALTLAGAILWFLAVLLLVWQWHKRRRGRQEQVHLPWRWSDTVWVGALVALPLLLFMLCLDLFPPQAVWHETAPSMLFGIALGIPVLVVGLACRRAWQRWREMGHSGRSSPAWLLLLVVMIGTAGYVVISRRALPLDELGLPASQYSVSLQDVLLPAGLAVGLFVIVALLVALMRPLRGCDWAARGARTSFVVRALVLLVLFAVAGQAAGGWLFYDTWTRYWNEGARLAEKGLAYYLGDDWIERHLLPKWETTATRPTTAPVDGEQGKGPG